MRALVFNNKLELKQNFEKPTPKENEALIKVKLVGICNTDYEITKGYMGYNGILGHEFVGVVEEINGEDKSLLGKRVVGEINLGCKNCDYCAKGLERHCPNRQTLGIFNKDGCFADYVTLPLSNLLEVSEKINNETAVFVEPLAAALEILEQLHIKPYEKVCVLGDGKLGLITALALNASNVDVTLVGKHQNKLDLAKEQNVKTVLLENLKQDDNKSFDVVVEATGRVSGFETSLSLVKPRGVLVLKSTIATGKELNLAPIVIDEITVLGSRCGQFAPALRLMEKNVIDFSKLVSAKLSFDDAILGFEKNKEKNTIKILLEM
ncbi:MAG: alcohol dehydrogenase catalytic domain-containing protein [Candidatus Gastranaerophilales bacterium]|nr:alcohol dehydrogenase catalytic domain-containing protein [Candidatus Gastranaerophilales bacterium]